MCIEQTNQFTGKSIIVSDAELTREGLTKALNLAISEADAMDATIKTLQVIRGVHLEPKIVELKRKLEELRK